MGGLQDSDASPSAAARRTAPAILTRERRRPPLRPWIRALATFVVVLLALATPIGGYAGYLRLTGNIHEFAPGAYRSGQLGGGRLSSFIRDHGIKTVINLRGSHPGKPWYDAEARAVAESGARHVNIALSANHPPDPVLLASLVEALKSAEPPLLIHCEAGSDRSGLAAALYELVVRHQSRNVADEQLSFRYGHFPWLTSRSGAMDRTFAEVAEQPR